MPPLPEKEELLQASSLLENIIGVGNLLTSPRHSHLWFTLRTEANSQQEGPLTAKELVEATGIPQSTIYEDLKDLQEYGVVEASGSSQPKRYKAEFLEVLAESPMLTFGRSVFVTQPYIGVVGYGYEDDNVEVFLERHGHGALYLGLEAYKKKAEDGGPVEDFAADVPDVPETDLALVEPAFEYALQELSRDPGFTVEYDL